MNTLKKFFPLSFGVNDLASLIIKIIIYLVLGAVIGFVLSIILFVPIINLLVGLAGTLAEIYILAGIVIAILDFCKVIK